ncbi:hypothetical protein AVEN_260920-1 [Araneus ventricosus]|uniref:Uncharacterized protein n=1 Tax=Araneus ventricosus TaxID=182803 RepID=A0A4Y2R6S0_ARAVE|nr:hypothetical protein AVEN_260920-1 [Araneus ventricosus]
MLKYDFSHSNESFPCINENSSLNKKIIICVNRDKHQHLLFKAATSKKGYACLPPERMTTGQLVVQQSRKGWRAGNESSHLLVVLFLGQRCNRWIAEAIKSS